MQVNVETKKIDVLRQEIFGWWIGGVGKENIRIDRAPDPNQFLDKLSNAAHPKPAHHRARDFVSDKVTKNAGMAGIFAHRFTHRLGNGVARRSLAQKFNVFRPRQCDQHSHSGSRTTVDKPARRRMINTHDIQSDLAH